MNCKCSALSATLRAFCGHASFVKHGDCRTAMAEAALQAGFRNRRKAAKEGVALSRQTWKAAKAGSKTALAMRGRRSKRADPECQQLVRLAAEANSQESAKFTMAKLPGETAAHPVFLLLWTSFPHSVYRQTEALLKAVSYSTFLLILRDQCPHIKLGGSLSNYCDHCETFNCCYEGP